ncbi:MAG: alpha/beta hydrolase [Beijerinckiaceae bacterium]|nr:alpha/beta hydrolase [Beijerinckiaceae bacterium]
MIVATTRSSVGAKAGEVFTGERGRDLAFVSIGVSVPADPSRKPGDIVWPTSPPDPARQFAALNVDPVDRAKALSLFHSAILRTPHRRVLVFVHGYNTRFEEAVFRFAQIMHDSGADAVPVLFTWPSRGRLLAYNYDRESTNYSRDGLEAVLTGLSNDPSVGEISILAHSMGNWVTLEALRQMAIRKGRLPPAIKNVMLAAPDVDIDVFRTQMRQLGTPRPAMTLFVSQDDQALAISRRIWGDVPRVGAIDPQAEPYRDELASEKIAVVDLTKLRSDDPLNHGKFAQNSEVVRLIGQRLIAGQSISESQGSLGERIGQVTTGAALTVGSAATLAISAPISIIDPATRDTLGDQADELGGTTADALRSTSRVVPTRP